MAHSFVVYVDESGDEGFAFDRGARNGSSAWFVLSAVVVRRSNDHGNVAVLDNVREKLNKPPRYALHFRNLKHEQKLAFLDAIPQNRYRIASVLVHKPSLNEPETFQRRYQMYFYFTRFLLERVSWLCRDNRRLSDGGDGSAKIIFSNRSNLSYDELRKYITHLELISEVHDVRIDWSIIKVAQIGANDHRRVAGLQLADAVASSMFSSVNINGYDMLEPRYTEMLKPITYHYKGRYLGYGLKMFPVEMPEQLALDERYNWLHEHFT